MHFTAVERLHAVASIKQYNILSQEKKNFPSRFWSPQTAYIEYLFLMMEFAKIRYEL
jgi:hypothetical protein